MQRLKAAGRVVKNRRLLFLLVFGVFTVGLILTVNAVSENDVFDGQAAPGDHNWWQDIGEATFCARCHQAVFADIAAGPHVAPGLSDCTFCHRPGGGDHAAAVAVCTDCHSEEGGELANDAHAGILVDLGETSTSAAQTCQSCHTHRSVNITSVIQPPLELNLGN